MGWRVSLHGGDLLKLSRTYIGLVDKYVNSRSRGGLLSVDGMAVAHNDISIIIFTPDGDREHIDPSDFCLEIKEYPNFKENVWKYIVAPYWDDRTIAYAPMPITIFLDNIKDDVDDTHKLLDIPVRTKLYDEAITTGMFKSDVAVNYGGMWINPELLYDVAKLITSKGTPVDIWIPTNKRNPAVVVGTNKYGRHIGFVLGTMKNFK